MSFETDSKSRMHKSFPFGQERPNGGLGVANRCQSRVTWKMKKNSAPQPWQAG